MLSTYADRTKKLATGKMVRVKEGDKNALTQAYLEHAFENVVNTFANEIEESIREYLWDGLYENSELITEELLTLGYFEETFERTDESKEFVSFQEESQGYKTRKYNKNKDKYWSKIQSSKK
jgi:hypothetical protein